MKLKGVNIIGTGKYLPKKILTNDELSRMVDTNDEWIFSRTGIRNRHIAADEQVTSDLAQGAAEQAISAAGISADSLDLVIVATATPDRPFPNTATILQDKIGATGAACFSMEAACTGFVYALEVASSMLRCGHYKRALVVGAEKLSNIINWKDRNTCVLFGDGAGAVVLQQVDNEDNGYLGSMLSSNGEHKDILQVNIGGSEVPFTAENVDDPGRFLYMAGREVFKLAVTNMADAVTSALNEADLSLDDVDWLIPHQANKRIISAVGDRIGIDPEKVVINVANYGNTSAASIPIAFDDLVRSGKIKAGQIVVFVAFGGGLTWGSVVLRF